MREVTDKHMHGRIVGRHGLEGRRWRGGLQQWLSHSPRSHKPLSAALQGWHADRVRRTYDFGGGRGKYQCRPGFCSRASGFIYEPVIYTPCGQNGRLATADCRGERSSRLWAGAMRLCWLAVGAGPDLTTQECPALLP